MTRALSRLLLFHAVVTFAAGVVLIVRPALIPSMVGIDLAAGARLLAYLLAACELGFATLSFLARSLRDPRSIAAVVASIVVMHASTAIVEVYMVTLGAPKLLSWNAVARVVVIAAFVVFGRPGPQAWRRGEARGALR